ncbi:MAG: cation transporter [Planctomycetaceae bacterium]|nr:cation transporter [Planctomycetaceae bacterium]
MSTSALIFVAAAVGVYAYSSNGTSSIPSVELNALFQLADKNKDGSISKDEFEQYLLHMRTKPTNTFTAADAAVNSGKAGGSCCGGKAETVKESAGSCCGGGKPENTKNNVAKTEKANSLSTPDASEASASDHASLNVGGSCGMCKKRIETAAKSLNGVVAATWDGKTQILKVAFNSPQTSLDAVSKAVAKVGHDTEKDKADDETYNALHGCCKYRK